MFDDNKTLVGVEEKPEHPQTNLAVTGIYLYKMKSYLEAFANISREASKRNEYEITHIHDWFLKNNYKLGYEEITGWWKDTGMPEDMVEGNQLLLNEMTLEEAVIDPTSSLVEDTRIQGRVQMGKDCIIGANVLIRGPVKIGNGVKLENCYIGPHTSVGDGVTIVQAEIEHSIVMSGSVIDTPGRIVDSIIGHNAQVTHAERTFPQGKRMIIGENSQVEV